MSKRRKAEEAGETGEAEEAGKEAAVREATETTEEDKVKAETERKKGEEAEEEEEEEEEEEKEKPEEAAEEAAEEAEEEKEEFVEERVYTIPLGRVWIGPRKERAPRAVRRVRSFIQRHMKPETLVLSAEVNERIWRRGIERPPRRIRVRAGRDKEDRVVVHLAEED